MRAVARWLAAGALGLLAGCSVHPRVDEVTGYEPRSVARIFRCQARNAYRGEMINLLRRYDFPNTYANWTGNQVADWLAADPRNFRNLDIKKLHRIPRYVIETYGKTIVAWDFTVDSTEMNSVGADLTLLKAFTRGSDTIGVKAVNDRTRQAKQQNRNYDTFDSLSRKTADDFCENIPEDPNVLYPSTGGLRLDKVVHDFIFQNQHENLGAEKLDFSNAETATTFTFTTKFVGNFDPDLKLNSIPGVYVPSELKLSVDNYRLDTHTVILLLRLAAKPSPVIFDDQGRITTVEVDTIAAKFDQIKQNNFRDDFRQVSQSLVGITR